MSADQYNNGARPDHWECHAGDYALTPGHNDEFAEIVFTRGHCHSFACALHAILREAGIPAEIVGAYWDVHWQTGEPSPDHVAVRLPDGRVLDVTGETTDYSVAYEEPIPDDWRPITEWHEGRPSPTYLPIEAERARPYAARIVAEYVDPVLGMAAA